MCRESEVESWGRAVLTRRQMGAIGAAGAVAACAPMASEWWS